MTSTVLYQGELRTEAVHQKSQVTLLSDAPTDNQGKGESFSPTDLIATALAQCVLTIIGIKARDLGIDITNSKAEILKIMADKPRKIDTIHINLKMLGNPSDKNKIILERAGLTCPVALSLHESVKQNITFQWN